MESIVLISKCTEREKVQYTSQMFKDEALEWWNTLIGIKGRDNLYNLDWETFKAMILKKLCPINEMDQIQTKIWNLKVVGTNLKEYNTRFLEYCRIVPHLVTPEINKVTRYIFGLPIEIHDHVRSHMPSSTESAVELAGYLMDGMIRNRDERKKDDGKTPVGGKIKKTEKKREGGFVYTRPFCKTCGRRHFGKCQRPLSTITCNYCKRLGHIEADCKKKALVCFECGEKGHFSTECPKKKPAVVTVGASGSGVKTDAKKGNARVFMLDTQRAAEIPDVITDKNYEVETADGSISRVTEALENVTISLANHVIHVRLLPMTLAGFDVVLGMDWLLHNQAHIRCNDKAIDIRTPNNKTIRIIGDKEGGKVEMISKIKASHCIGKGCLAIMAYVTKEPEPKKMKEVPIGLNSKTYFRMSYQEPRLIEK
ncbi:uncharacterized protein LOC143558055 [Bidens hawaiensis]|uniref:uncharacterized protein LOC143558055 n=1 Tax=Bidens hawaiensis TaxID=980011 RepID=UPI004049A3CE